MSRYLDIQTALTASLFGLLIADNPASIHAEAAFLSAADLQRTMNDEQQYYYVSGIIAGLETTRYIKDGNETGSSCIDRWYYNTSGVRDVIRAAFTRFGDKSPSAILYALTSKACGK